MNRRRFLQTSAGTGAALLLTPAPLLRAADSAVPDADLLAQARERIAQHRQAEGVIKVVGADGRPVAGVTVEVGQVRHDFLFGCNLFRFDRVRDPGREAAYRERFAALLNFATLGFYWPAFEGERGRPNYEYMDRVLEWTRTQRIRCKGHPLVWDFADPRWLPREFAEIRELSHARVREIVDRFKGRLDLWDVVNEPTHLGRFHTRLGEWAQSVGAVPYVIEHLKIAREANPSATLLVNDYRTDLPFREILEACRDQGKWLFDAVGIQSHMHGGGWPLRQIWDVCDRFATLRLPVHFTETTIVSGPRLAGDKWGETTPEGEAAQAEYVPKFYTMLFAHPAVRALTWWDFSDDAAWQGAAAGLVRKDMSPKPVYDRLQGLLQKEWWTRKKGTTDATGQFKLSAFFGTHSVKVDQPGGASVTREIHWEQGTANAPVLRLA